MRHCARLLFISLVAAPTFAQHSAAQTPAPTVSAQDYARAEKFLAWNTAPLVSGATVRVTWLDGDKFWYRNSTPQGFEFVLVDPVRHSRARAFDQDRVAAALSAAAGRTYDAWHLPFGRFDMSADGRSLSFETDDAHKRFTCDVGGNRCTPQAVGPNVRSSVVSPDGKLAAFIRSDNLWVHDLTTGNDRQLTTDGVKDFGYATDNAGWTQSDRPVIAWSPDSKKIATFQQDQRNVGEMYLVETRVGHPVLEQWKYPLPGDSIIPTIQRVVIDLNGPRVIRFQMPPDQHRSTTCDHILCGREFADVEWSPDASHLAFVSTSRDHKHETLRVADASTGAVRDVMQESVATFYEAGDNAANWRVLDSLHQVIWYSERDDWGNLYLYDLASGALVKQITTGPGNVLQILRVDQKERAIYFTSAGRDPNVNPYFRQLYRVRLDGTHLQLLSPENADHEVSLSPDGRYFVDSWSRPDVPPVTVLRDGGGRTVMPLEKADISRLVAAGWEPPMPITVKARDGKTELYGLLFRPTNFDSTKKYPIINHIYPGPQVGSVGSRFFAPSRGDAQSLAELGFVVVEIDAMGTPMRSHAFHAAYYGNMGDNGLPDQIAAMKQLAQRYSWIDLDRAGIYGHSGGGYATADAMLRYPDVFKVGVSEAGNHDNREYEDDWGEKWQGLLVRNGDGTTSYDDQANQNMAANLKGKLLIAFGTTDNNVPPYNSLLLVNELIKHNKDFDLTALPNRRHGFGNEPYMIRRRWDYFVRYLLGAEPPAGYEIHGPRPGAPLF
jgi:dipeptidyl-peptidase-4